PPRQAPWSGRACGASGLPISWGVSCGPGVPILRIRGERVLKPADPGQRVITNLPKATPRLQPSPLPASASDTSPLVMTWALLDLPALACASALTYVPSTSSMLLMPENSPRPSSIRVFPNVRPPPLVLICTAMLCPLSQLTVPLPFPVL